MTGPVTLCLVSLASIASFIAGVWWATARNEVLQRKADPFAAPGMPFAGIIEADFETIVRWTEGQ